MGSRKLLWPMVIGLFCVAILIFSNPNSPTDLLIHVRTFYFFLNPVTNPLVTNNRRPKCALVVHESLAPHVHGPSHSSRPSNCGWLATCACLHENTSNPLLIPTWKLTLSQPMAMLNQWIERTNYYIWASWVWEITSWSSRLYEKLRIVLEESIKIPQIYLSKQIIKTQRHQQGWTWKSLDFDQLCAVLHSP